MANKIYLENASEFMNEQNTDCSSIFELINSGKITKDTKLEVKVFVRDTDINKSGVATFNGLNAIHNKETDTLTLFNYL